MMGDVALLVPLVSAVAGATIGFAPTYLLERRKQRAALAVRWDASLYGLCADFSSAARQLLAIAETEVHAKAEDRPVQEHLAERLAEPHLRLRSLMEQIRLLGGLELQLAALAVRHHAYSAVDVALGRSDPHEDEEGYEEEPTDRLRGALLGFYEPARAQLGVLNAGDVARTHRGA
jgi:hypothetical protein